MSNITSTTTPIYNLTCTRFQSLEDAIAASPQMQTRCAAVYDLEVRRKIRICQGMLRSAFLHRESGRVFTLVECPNDGLRLFEEFTPEFGCINDAPFQQVQIRPSEADGVSISMGLPQYHRHREARKTLADLGLVVTTMASFSH